MLLRIGIEIVSLATKILMHVWYTKRYKVTNYA